MSEQGLDAKQPDTDTEPIEAEGLTLETGIGWVNNPVHDRGLAVQYAINAGARVQDVVEVAGRIYKFMTEGTVSNEEGSVG